jgi:opacity protein-like surface antigen
MGGIRYRVPFEGWAQPYFDAGLGVANLEPVFHGTSQGRDITRDLRVIGIPSQTLKTWELMWSVGGGGTVGRYRGIALDFGYRFLAIDGTTVAHIHRVQVGIGYAF